MRDLGREIDDDVFRDVERIVAKILESNAKRFRHQLGMTYDEALNEARFGLMIALRKYDYNDSRGGIFNFAAKAVNRHFLKIWSRYAARRRRPHIELTDDEGKKILKPLKFARPEYIQGEARHEGGVQPDFMDLLESPAASPDAELVADDMARTAAAFQAALYAALSERDCDVLRCKLDPPSELRTMMLEELMQEPTIPLIGKYLGLSKNEVDWALRRIRDKALELIGREFSGLSAQSIVRKYVERRL